MNKNMTTHQTVAERDKDLATSGSEMGFCNHSSHELAMRVIHGWVPGRKQITGPNPDRFRR